MLYEIGLYCGWSFLTIFWQSSCCAVLLAAAVSPPSLLSSSLMAQFCFLTYQLASTPTLQYLTTVSQKHISTSARRRHLALDLSSEEQATFIRLWHSLGGCIVVWFVVCSSFRCCLTLYPMILRHLHPFVADRRATARTTETFSHAAISKKKLLSCGHHFCFYLQIPFHPCCLLPFLLFPVPGYTPKDSLSLV